MAARQLWLLRVFSGQFVSDTIEKLHIALLGVFLEGRHESPRHGSRSLGCDSGVGTVGHVSSGSISGILTTDSLAMANSETWTGPCAALRVVTVAELS